MNTTKITALTTKFLGVKGTVYRLFKNGELADTVVGLASKEDLAGRLEQQLQ